MEMTLEQYKAMRESGASAEQIAGQRASKPLGGAVGGAARFLGIEEFGRGLATVGNKGVVKDLEQSQMGVVDQQNKVLARIKEKRAKGEDTSRLIKALKDTSTVDTADAIRDIGTDNLTNKEFLGSAAMVGLNVLGGSTLSKGGSFTRQVVKAAPSTILRQTGKGAALGGAYGAANAVREDKPVLPALITGMALGGATSFVFSTAAKAISSALSKGPQSQMAKVLRQGKADLAAEEAGRKPNLSQQMIEKGVRGSDEKIITDGTTKLINLEKNIQATLERNKNTAINTVDLVRSLDDMVRRKRNIFGQAGVNAINEFKKNLMAKGEKIGVIEANQLKRDIYKELSDAAFNKETLPQGKEMLRTIASQLRSSIAKAVPSVARLTKDQQFYIRMLDNIESRMRGMQKLNELGLSDTIFAATAIGTGEPTALAAGLIKRGVERTTFRTNSAVALNKINDLVKNLPTDSAGRVSKQVLMNLIGKIAPEVGGSI